MSSSDRPFVFPAKLRLFNGVIWCCGCFSDITNDPNHNCHMYLRDLKGRIAYLKTLTMLKPDVRAKYIQQAQTLIDAYCEKEGIVNEQLLRSALRYGWPCP